MKPRSRAKQTKSLQERLAEFAADARREAADIPEGPARDKLLRAVKRAEAASAIEALARSPREAPK